MCGTFITKREEKQVRLTTKMKKRSEVERLEEEGKEGVDLPGDELGAMTT
jgi:hypothetical protein